MRNFSTWSSLRTVIATVAVSLWTATLSAAPIQSPIDIRSENSIFALLPELQFAYSMDTPVTFLNNGSPEIESTIKGLVPSGAGHLTLSDTIWPLLQFHFHTESEHGINGAESEMELHMVHQLATGEYLVVGRFLTIGAHNAALDELFSNLPPNPNDTLDVEHFDLTALLPTDLRSFRYTGSLTTSPYTEGVNWVVLNSPLELSMEQVDAFRELFPKGNEREWQRLNGRMILTDVEGFAKVPEPTSLALLGTGVYLFVVRRSRGGRRA